MKITRDAYDELRRLAQDCPAEYSSEGKYGDDLRVKQFSEACKNAGFPSLAVMALKGKAWPWYVRMAGVWDSLTAEKMDDIEKRASASLQRGPLY